MAQRLTRRDRVLLRLNEAHGAWVNGTELANAAVGGSEGLRRLRELRADGWPIEERRHPDSGRTVRQYRLRTSLAGQQHATEPPIGGAEGVPEVVMPSGPAGAHGVSRDVLGGADEPSVVDLRGGPANNSAERGAVGGGVGTPSVVDLPGGPAYHCSKCGKVAHDVQLSFDPRFGTGRCYTHGRVQVTR